MTDVLGTMTSWDGRSTVVAPEDGAPVEIAIRDIVSGKPVPPRPSVRLRVAAAEAERRAVAGWPPVVAEPLGSWLLRAAGGFSARANSVLVLGDPGLPLEEALARVVGFYAEHRLPAWAQAVVGSPELAALESAGWVPARPGEADSRFQVASVAATARVLRRLDVPAVAVRADLDTPPGSGDRPDHPWALTTSGTASACWLAVDARPDSDPEVARAVLEGPPEVGFVSVTRAEDPGTVVAKGRVSHARDWAGVTDVWVSPDHRRRGLALAVIGALLQWSAERGATTAYLQTRGDNPAALALYDRLGFRTHHEYRYLTTP